MGLDHTILYQKGEENVIADALSRREVKENEGQCYGITAVVPEWVKVVEKSYESTNWVQSLLTKLAIQTREEKGYSLANGLIRFQGRLVIGDDKELKEKILKSLHCSPLRGHSGIQATYHKIRQLLF